jgi:hypothetical protein
MSCAEKHASALGKAFYIHCTKLHPTLSNVMHILLLHCSSVSRSEDDVKSTSGSSTTTSRCWSEALRIWRMWAAHRGYCMQSWTC